MTRLRVGIAILALSLWLSACLTERPPDELFGQLYRVGLRYRVTACGTDDSFELRLATALQVNLDRRAAELGADDDSEAGAKGPMRVRLGGRSLPPTRETAPTRIFQVWKIDLVESGHCP